jgi:hypothetical protein
MTKLGLKLFVSVDEVVLMILARRRETMAADGLPGYPQIRLTKFRALEGLHFCENEPNSNWTLIGRSDGAIDLP